ncbi:MAG: hypothetical protein IJF83_06940 [Methanobrevibacter sp.]|nr:hypothetical protein [Methanobrevibacter sp.]
MQVGDTFPCVVSGRVTNRAKYLMKKEGFSVRDAVEWFVDARCSNKKKLEVDKYFLEKEIKELEQKLQIKRLEYENVLDEIAGDKNGKKENQLNN